MQGGVSQIAVRIIDFRSLKHRKSWGRESLLDVLQDGEPLIERIYGRCPGGVQETLVNQGDTFRGDPDR